MGLKSLLSGLGLVPDLGVQMVGPSRKFVFRDLTCRSSLLDHFAENKKNEIVKMETEKWGVMKRAVKWTSTVDQIEKRRMVNVDVDVDREKYGGQHFLPYNWS